MNKNFFAEILIRKPELVKGIVCFNKQEPKDYSPPIPDSIQGLSEFGVDVESLWKMSTLRNKYAKIPLTLENTPENSPDQLSTEDVRNEPKFENYWDFAEESKRLALLDLPTLQKLILYFGTALNAKEIAQCIEKEKVISIHQTIGKNAYFYALNKGQFQLGDSVKKIDIIYDFEKKYPLNEQIIIHGILAINICTKDWTAELRKRVQKNILEFAREKNINVEELEAFLLEFSFDDVTPAIKRHVWFSLKKILTKELAPLWVPYFD